MNRSHPVAIVLCFLVVVFSFLLSAPYAEAEETDPTTSPGWDRVSSDSLMTSVRWLSDDARGGRMTGTPQLEEAADWIVGKFKSYGLEPAFDSTYYQEFEVSVGMGYGEGNALSISGAMERHNLELLEDYAPFAFSESGTVDVPVVFAGYGITAEEYDYDDYAGLDVEGKAVLILRHEPQQDDSESVFNGTSNSPHAMFRAKAQNAREHGAAAVLLFTGPQSPEYEDDELVAAQRGQAIGGSELLAAHIRKDIGEALVELAGINTREWMKSVDEDLKPRSAGIDPEVRIRLVVSMNKDFRTTSNVAAILPGTDPHAGALVLGAHYDHLGLGNSSSLAPSKIGEIHNGADDNASGTAGIIELARIFSSEAPIRRTLIFVAFTGEEIGLQGSREMVNEPPLPLEWVQAMLNLDMIGRPNNQKLVVSGVGSSPEFGPLLDRIEPFTELEFSRDQSGIGASDHTSFYLKDVPVLFFFTGAHEDYHRPSDDWEKIDTQGIAEVTRVVYAMARDLGDRPQRVEFAKAPEDTTGGSGEGSGTSGSRGYGPYLGTIPDFGDHDNGVKLTGVREGSPAEKAGVQGGDVVIRFGGLDIADLYEYTDALRAHHPGDVVEIVVLRDGEEVTLTATLGMRE